MGAMAVVLMAGVSVKTFAAENLLNQIKSAAPYAWASKAPTSL